MRRVRARPEVTTNALIELYRHKTWATLRLIEHCAGLADEHLDATIPGTYGTIRDTLRHIVAAEEGFMSILTRERFVSKAAAQAFVLEEPLPEGPVALDELAARIRRLGPRWEALAQDTDLPSRELTSRDGWYMPGVVSIAMAILHAGDHRSHIMSILGARGLKLPEPNGLDMLGYAESAGLLREMEV